MRFPLWAVGLAVLLWGWSCEVLPVAGPVALALVWARGWRGRFAVSDAEFHRAFEVCWVLFFGGLLLTYNREPAGSVLRAFVRWLPLVLLPAVAAQVASERGAVPVGALVPFPAWRRRHRRSRAEADVVAPYWFVCLVAGSVAGGGRGWFYGALAAVMAPAIWSVRSVPVRRRAAGALLALGLAGGWGVAVAVGGVQGWLENRLLAWVSQWRRDDDPVRVSRTAIGASGRVGGSSRVVFTVQNAGAPGVPGLFRLGTFSTWREGTWHARVGESERLEGAGDAWVLDPRTGDEGGVRVELRPGRTSGVLPLPAATCLVSELPAEAVERTPLGSVRVSPVTGVLGYRAGLSDAAAWESPPGEEDRSGVPAGERKAVAAVVEDLGLAGRDPGEVLRRLARFFEGRFRYTTLLEDVPSTDPRAGTPLGRFLLERREGHCEYFATASVLLLRAAGVPARYATGFVVGADAEEEGVVRVREREAHAWVRVWVEGAWHDFDPTPAAAREAEGLASGWSRRWADLWFGLARWWWLGEKRWLRQAYWLAVPLLLVLFWRLRGLRTSGRPGEAGGQPGGAGAVWPGLDSEWYAVAGVLRGRGWLRKAGESLAAWRRRLEAEAAAGTGGRARRVVAAGELHERLRFDPAGLAAGEREELRAGCAALAVELGAVRPPAGSTTA